jgi:hypothetical protein
MHTKSVSTTALLFSLKKLTTYTLAGFEPESPVHQADATTPPNLLSSEIN